MCREGCILEHRQAVAHTVCAERPSSTRSTGHDIHCFLSNIVADKCHIRIIHLPNYFSPLLRENRDVAIGRLRKDVRLLRVKRDVAILRVRKDARLLTVKGDWL